MSTGLDIAIFGSSLVSAYWNGAATYYRGMVRALAARGHRIRFYEPDAFDRQRHRDLADPPWARVIVYPGDDDAAALAALASALDADLLIKTSGVGVYDALLEDAVAAARGPSRTVAFWDVDAPATLERLRRDPADPFHRCVPRFDLVLTYGGGAPVVACYESLGAKRCVPINNALDPTTHFPGRADARFAADLGFLGNRLPDREARVESFFLDAAGRLPQRRFVLGGNGWSDRALPPNVVDVGHVYTTEHNAFNASCRAVLSISRASMAACGFSPATRVFEAAGAAACLITDAWEGIERFLEPGREVLVAHDGAEVASLLEALDADRARRIGEAALARVLAEHTYAHRAAEFDAVLEGCSVEVHR
ncbi:MAG: glycosyltransferase [Lautropia sp.]